MIAPLCILLGWAAGIAALALLSIANPKRVSDGRSGDEVPFPAEVGGESCADLDAPVAAIALHDERDDGHGRPEIEASSTRAERGDLARGSVAKAATTYDRDDVFHDQSMRRQSETREVR